MSLWTPGGEHPVDRPGSEPATDPAASTDTGADTGAYADLPPEERSRAEALAGEMAQVRQQLLSVPAAMVVANHAMGLYELAAIHLSDQPPNLGEAQVAIDAYGALVDTVGDRLGEDAATLRDALAQIRLAFVQIKAGVDQADSSGEAGPE